MSKRRPSVHPEFVKYRPHQWYGSLAILVRTLTIELDNEGERAWRVLRDGNFVGLDYEQKKRVLRIWRHVTVTDKAVLRFQDDCRDLTRSLGVRNWKSEDDHKTDGVGIKLTEP